MSKYPCRFPIDPRIDRVNQTSGVNLISVTSLIPDVQEKFTDGENVLFLSNEAKESPSSKSPNFVFNSIRTSRDTLEINDNHGKRSTQDKIKFDMTPSTISGIQKSKLTHSIRFIIFILITIIVLLLIAFWLVSSQRSQWDRLVEIVKTKEDLLRQALTTELVLESTKQKRISNEIMNLFNGTKIMENLRWISSEVHVSGTPGQIRLMKRLENQYRLLGFDVKSYEYEVLLSYPDYRYPNTIHFWNSANLIWELISRGVGEPVRSNEELLKQQLDKSGFLWWNAYSKRGVVEAPIIYLNYGTEEDYKMVEKLKLKIRGKIALIRYGATFRGYKIRLAEHYGVVGVILYSDPFDYAPEKSPNMTFPNDIWLSPLEAQRGTLLLTFGDPTTPSVPSKALYMHRRFTEENLRANHMLPNIPVTPIGYGDAAKIFIKLDGNLAPWSDWIGSLNVSYRLTGSARFRLTTNNKAKMRKIRNFVAKLYGKEEPDEWVLLGNHADAWVKGSIDPGTGTATMLEAARVLSHYHKQTGWKPRRTIVFCQWDGEEFGLIGSSEWVEEMKQILEHRAIVYLNVDNINGNNSLQIKAVPLLYRAIADAASRIRIPQPIKLEAIKREPTTLLDAWRFYSQRMALPGDKSIPAINSPIFGSDFVPFVSTGIPVADLRMESAPRSTYMLYHTAYEVPWVNEHLLDPRHLVYSTFGKFWLELVRQLADRMIIPFNVEDYGIMLGEFYLKLLAQLRHSNFYKMNGTSDIQDQLNYLKQKIQIFQNKASSFQRVVQNINNGLEELSLRRLNMINYRLRTVERAFTHQSNHRNMFLHLIFSPSEFDNFSGFALTSILDPIFKWLQQARRNNDWKSEFHLATIYENLAKVQNAVDSAAENLDLNSNF